MMDWMGNLYGKICILLDTELEIFNGLISNIISYILGKMIGLPTEFLTNEEGSKGGGVIQVSNLQFHRIN